MLLSFLLRGHSVQLLQLARLRVSSARNVGMVLSPRSLSPLSDVPELTPQKPKPRRRALKKVEVVIEAKLDAQAEATTVDEKAVRPRRKRKAAQPPPTFTEEEFDELVEEKDQTADEKPEKKRRKRATTTTKAAVEGINGEVSPKKKRRKAFSTYGYAYGYISRGNPYSLHCC